MPFYISNFYVSSRLCFWLRGFPHKAFFSPFCGVGFHPLLLSPNYVSMCLVTLVCHSFFSSYSRGDFISNRLLYPKQSFFFFLPFPWSRVLSTQASLNLITLLYMLFWWCCWLIFSLTDRRFYFNRFLLHAKHFFTFTRSGFTYLQHLVKSNVYIW